MGFNHSKARRPSGMIVTGYTIGVSQNQNCSITAMTSPTSRANTLSTPSSTPIPVASTNVVPINTGNHSQWLFGINPKTGRMMTITASSATLLTSVIPTAIKGREMRGKRIFFNKLPFSTKIVRQRLTISLKSDQQRIPASM